MSLNASLADKTIVVTRPLARAQKIFELLEAKQANVIHFPVISISLTSNLEIPRQYFQNLEDYHAIIFISANAVHFAFQIVQELGINFKAATLAAVGPATKAALEGYGCEVSIAPAAGFTSEALLEEAALQNLAQQKVLIVRGQGGREHLRQVLESRHAEVDYAEVYQRQIPSQRNAIDLSQLPITNTVVLIYSVESVQNLWSLCSKDEKQFLTNITTIVGSNRIAEAVSKCGFAKDSIIAENPSDEAMLAAVDGWA